MVEGKCKADVGAYNSCVEGAVEPSKFHSFVSVEETMKVAKIVSTGMVMGISCSAVSFVPDVLNSLHGFGIFSADLINQYGIHFLAVSKSFGIYLQCLVKKVVFAVNNFDKIFCNYSEPCCHLA